MGLLFLLVSGLALGAGEREGLSVEAARFRMTAFAQSGSGYQSQAGLIAGPGDERLFVLQPQLQFLFRQDDRITHELVLPVDVVSAASANALDVISAASAVTEATGFEVSTRAELGEDDAIRVSQGFHHEETLVSGIFGLNYSRELAEDNAVLSLSAHYVADRTKNNTIHGKYKGARRRSTAQASAEFSQILTPTTLFSAGYGATLQVGTLETTWNSVPTVSGQARLREIFPHERLRQTLKADLAQHIPFLDASLRGAYRYYWDDFLVSAHTFEIQAHQELHDRWLVRGSYRRHQQTAAFFFATSVPDAAPDVPRTADSDLGQFEADEWGLKLAWLRTPQHALDVSYYHYARTNGLRAHIASVGYAGTF